MTLLNLKNTAAVLSFGLMTTQALASGCEALPDHTTLTAALKASTATTSESTTVVLN